MIKMDKLIMTIEAGQTFIVFIMKIAKLIVIFYDEIEFTYHPHVIINYLERHTFNLND